MEKISDIFGSMVFNDAVMRERLPKETYRQVQATMEKGKRLDDDAARMLRLVPNIAIHFDLCILIQANKARIREAVGSCWIIVVVLAARDVLGQLDWLEDKGLGGQLPLMLGHE